MTQRSWTLFSSFAILTAVGMLACSSADTPEDGDDDSGTGGSASGTGGTGATGGTTSPTGGSGGSGAPTGGSTSTGGAGGGGGVNTDPECKGIRSNMACTPEGKDCQNLVCGLADSGTRSCLCATNWSCMPCDFTNSPFRDRPADPIPMCPAEAADEAACTAAGTVCGPVGSEYCACYQDATDGLIWDCDSPPSSWGM